MYIPNSPAFNYRFPMQKKIIYSLLMLCLISSGLKAQLFVTTDYGNCGMGLKDSAGNWVLPAHYNSISKEGNFYLLNQGEYTGVANRYGKIIVPVIYDTVKPEHITSKVFPIKYSWFRVRTKDKYGVLDTNNRIIVPVQYEFIRICANRTFLVRSGKRNWLVYHEDGTFNDMHLRQKNAPVYSGPGLYEVYNKWTPGLLHPYNPYKKRKYNKSGLVNEQGETILPKKHKDIKAVKDSSDLIVALRKGEIIFYRQNGSELFRFDAANDYYEYDEFAHGMSSPYSSINSLGYSCVKLGYKWGLVSQKGDTILPFEYDELDIESVPDSYPAKYLIKTKKKGVYGLYDPETNTHILKTEYQYIRICRNYINSADSSSVQVFVLEKNNKYALVSSTGQELIPYTIEARRSMGDEWQISMDGDLYQMSFPWMNTKLKRHYISENSSSKIVHTIPASGTFEKRYLSDGTILFLNPDLINDSAANDIYNNYLFLPNTLDSLIHATAIVLKKQEPYLTINPEAKLYAFKPIGAFRDSTVKEEQVLLMKQNNETTIYAVSKSWSDKNFTYFKTYDRLLRSDGLNVLKNYKRLNEVLPMKDSLGNFYINIETKKYKHGIVDGNGKLLVDTIWNELKYAGDHYLSAKKYETYKKRKQYPDKYHYYNLIDLQTGQTVLPNGYHSNSEITTGYHCATIARSNSGIGIYNFDTHAYSVPPVLNRLLKLDSAGKYFAAKTCSGKIGIVSWDGKWLADTVWSAMINASYPVVYSQFDRRKYIKETVVLSDSGKWLIFDTKTASCSSSRSLADSLFVAAARNRINTYLPGLRPYAFSLRCYNCPSMDTLIPDNELNQIVQWERHLLFDSLFACQTFYYDTSSNYYIYQNSRNSHCSSRNPNYKSEQYPFQKEYENGYLRHKIIFRNDSCISVKRTGGYQNKYFTAVLFSDGPHPVLIDSLFTGTEWRSFLINEVMNYLNTHNEITGNCSNPAAIPFLLKTNFNITKEGLALYMPGYQEGYKKLEIVIPWEKLKPYLRPEMASKIGVN